MEDTLTQRQFLSRIYSIMTLGLLITFAVAWWISRYHPALLFRPMAMILLVLAQVVVVIAFGKKLHSASVGSVTAMFLAYSVLNGVTMSSIFLAFQLSSVYLAFFGAAVAFGLMALYGSLTRRDLSPLRQILWGGLIALIVLTLVGLLLGADRLQLLICWLGILVFLGLTAYDAQKLLQLYRTMPEAGGKLAIYGALQLYLDFINLFQYILILTGSRRQR